MNQSFVERHLFNIFKNYEIDTFPLDIFLSNYFRKHKAVGAKDRRYLSETVYGMVRWRGLLDYLCQPPLNWENRYHCYLKINPLKFVFDPAIPPHIRVSFPKSLFDLLEQKYGLEKALQLCLLSNQPAPLTLRVNLLKTQREVLLKKWEGVYPVSPCIHSSYGIIFHKKTNFFAMEEFKQGLFEIQDEGSQLIADLVAPQPKQQILDFCAGSGGKTLAFAPKTHASGQIYLHDIRPHALKEAKKRLKRAGIQNAQILMPNDLEKKSLKHKMHWVLVDVPCTGSGTLRRNPDMKWKFHPDVLKRLVEEQRQIFQTALEYLHPKGHIVYATCSIFPQENEEQVTFFKEKWDLELTQAPFQSLPIQGGMDGFFGAVFNRRL